MSDVKVDPNVPPVLHARRKASIKFKEAIEKELDYLEKEDIITPQIGATS